MQETETGKKTEEQPFGQELVSYVENLKFGTNEFQAVSDFFELRSLRESLLAQKDLMRADKDDPVEFQTSLIDVQRTSQKMGLLEHEIYMGQSRLEGYSNAYGHIWNGVERVLESDANKEAATKFPDDDKERNDYAKRLYYGTVDKIGETVHSKMEGSKVTE